MDPSSPTPGCRRSAFAIAQGRSWHRPIIRAAAAAVSGALGGLAYTGVRRPFGRLGRAGHYLTGVTSLVTAFGAFGFIFSVLGEDPKLNGPTDWLLLLGVGAVIGLFVGHGWSKAAADTHSV